MKDRHSNERRISALAVSRGFAVGPIYFFEEDELKARAPHHVRPDEIEHEIEQFRTAARSVSHQLKALSPPGKSAKEPISHILGVQLLMVEDSPFIEHVESVIRYRAVNAASAVRMVAEEHIQQQSTVADPHLREMRLDIEDVAARLIKAIDGAGKSIEGNGLSGCVVVARELRPSAVMEFAKQKPAAFVTERGGWTSHSSIIARECQIPMVSGVRDLRQTFSGVGRAMVDGIAGAVVLDPGPGTVDHTGSVSRLKPIAAGSHQRMTPPITLDGVKVIVRANVDSLEAYSRAETAGAAGIGLFRSESLIKHGRFPTEDEQYEVYKNIAGRTGAEGLKVRTFDLGADELADTSNERNPALGLRSLRLSLADPGRFRAQVRAVLRAAADCRIDIVLPMVSDAADLARARDLIDEEKAQLASTAAIGDPRIGAMIETPSAVLTIGAIARHVDFICLGTNDLVQYLLAVDRDNQSVAEWYQSLHPSVLGAIRDVIAACNGRNVPVQVCGEMAGSPFYVPLLIGLGARELSMNTNSIQPIRRVISGINASDCAALAERTRSSERSRETEILLRDHYAANWADLFPPGLLDSRHI